MTKTGKYIPTLLFFAAFFIYTAGIRQNDMEGQVDLYRGRHMIDAE